MKSRFLLAGLVPVFALGSLLVAQEGPFAGPASRPARSPISAEAPPDLHRLMETMERMTKRIAAQIDDKSKDASTLAALNNLQVCTALAKSALPDAIGELSGAEKAKAIADYRSRMISLLHTELAMEEAILRDDRAAAREALSKLADQRKDGHAAYDVDDHHH